MKNKVKVFFDQFLKVITDEHGNIKDLYKILNTTTNRNEQIFIERLLKSKAIKDTYEIIKEKCKQYNTNNLSEVLQLDQNLPYLYDENLNTERLMILKQQENRVADELALMYTIAKIKEDKRNEAYQHLARFEKSSTENIWLPTKKLDHVSNFQIDVARKDNYYLYYIQEDKCQTLLLTSDLFLDFNKNTNYNGKKIEIQTISATILSNLTGYFCEYEKDSSENLKRKTEYFQTSDKNIYNQTNGLPIIIRSFDPSQILLLNNATISKENNYYQIKNSQYLEYADFLLTNQKIHSDISTLIQKDTEYTNPEDLPIIKTFFENPTDFPQNKTYTKK